MAPTGAAFRDSTGSRQWTIRLDGKKDYERVVKAAVLKLASMFTPVGALVQALVAGWELLQTLRTQLGRIFGVDFAPDGKRIVSGSADKTLRLWEIATDKLLKMLCDRLSHHPDLTQPQTDVAQEAQRTCKQYAGP